MVRIATLDDRLDDALRIGDPITRHAALRELADDLDRLGRDVRRARSGCVNELREAGLTWREVGGRLGLSTQRAEQLAR